MISNELIIIDICISFDNIKQEHSLLINAENKIGILIDCKADYQIIRYATVITYPQFNIQHSECLTVTFLKYNF